MPQEKDRQGLRQLFDRWTQDILLMRESIGIDKGSYYKMIDRAFTYAGTKRNV